MPVRFLRFYPQFRQANTLKDASGISKENELDGFRGDWGRKGRSNIGVKIEFQF